MRTIKDCAHDLSIGGGSRCIHCGKDLVFFRALTSVAEANIGFPLLKLSEVLKDAAIPMGKLAKALRKLQVRPKVSQ